MSLAPFQFMTPTRRKIVFGFLLVLLASAGFSAFWQQRPADDIRLVLTIPASRIDVFEHGERTRSLDVSVGRRGFETPAGKYRISSVIWNPWWHPPKSEWARGEKPTPPGPGNPMGRVKINFANLYYIHGTPYEDDLGIPASHGCIRIGDKDLQELARLIHKYRTPKVDPDLLATLTENRTMTRNFAVKPIPFEVQYRLVEVVNNKLVIHPDVYRSAGSDLREEVIATLKQEGISISDRI